MVAILSFSMSADLWPAEPAVPSLCLAGTWYLAAAGGEWWLALGERQHGVVQAAQRAGAQREPSRLLRDQHQFHMTHWLVVSVTMETFPSSCIRGWLVIWVKVILLPPSLPPALPHSLSSPPRLSRHTLPSDKMTVTLPLTSPTDKFIPRAVLWSNYFLLQLKLLRNSFLCICCFSVVKLFSAFYEKWDMH